jgi:hypothetical protein
MDMKELPIEVYLRRLKRRNAPTILVEGCGYSFN